MGEKRHADGTVTKGGIRYGCHVDTANDQEIDGCVVDSDDHGSCKYAIFRKSGRRRISKWTCSYWNPLPLNEVARREQNENGT